MILIFQFSRFLAEKTSCAISIHSEASEENATGTGVTGVTAALLYSTFLRRCHIYIIITRMHHNKISPQIKGIRLNK